MPHFYEAWEVGDFLYGRGMVWKKFGIFWEILSHYIAIGVWEGSCTKHLPDWVFTVCYSGSWVTFGPSGEVLSAVDFGKLASRDIPGN